MKTGQLAEYKIFIDKGVDGEAQATYREIEKHRIMMTFIMGGIISV
jgi:hypothetical protein